MLELKRLIRRYRWWMFHKGFLQGLLVGLFAAALTLAVTHTLYILIIPAAALAVGLFRAFWPWNRAALYRRLDRLAGLDEKLLTAHQYAKQHPDNPFLSRLLQDVNSQIKELNLKKRLAFGWMPEGMLVIVFAASLVLSMWMTEQAVPITLSIIQDQAIVSTDDDIADPDSEEPDATEDEVLPDDSVERDLEALSREDLEIDPQLGDDPQLQSDRDIAADRLAREIEEQIREFEREPAPTEEPTPEAFELREGPLEEDEAEEAEEEALILEEGEEPGEELEQEPSETEDNGLGEPENGEAEAEEPEADSDDPLDEEADMPEDIEEEGRDPLAPEEDEDPDAQPTPNDDERDMEEDANGAQAWGFGESPGDLPDLTDEPEDVDPEYYAAQLESQMRDADYLAFFLEGLVDLDQDLEPEQLDERFLTYRELLLNQLADERIPIHYRDWVRDYFSLITAD